MAISEFTDKVRILIKAGDGGDGMNSFKAFKGKPACGPDGGDGGKGGSIILKGDSQYWTLIHLKYQRHQFAEDGQCGSGARSSGKDAKDIVIPVPLGTVARRVVETEDGETELQYVGEVTEHGEELVLLKGGRGGLGNWHFKTATNQAPRYAQPGEPMQEMMVILELKLLADVGLVGFPSAGKSSLIAAISRARPKIADYPFTTLIPNLGVVVAGDVTYTVADVPGLIEGASEGKGLGFDFLRHIERCQAIVHVIDLGTYEPGRDPLTDLEVIEGELEAHGGLEDRVRLIALNKMDLPDARDLAEISRPELEKLGLPIFEISTKTGEGLNELKFRMAEIVAARRAALPEATPKPVIRPTPVARRKGTQEEFTIARKGDGDGGFVWRVRGDKPERWIRQTDFNNAEAVGYLADRLNRLGVETKLLEMGAEPGDAVAIGAGDNPVVFDFAPQVDIGAETLGRRGEDHRLDSERPSVTRRRQLDAEYHAAKAEMEGDG